MMKFLNRFKKPKVTFWTKEVGLTDIAPIKEHIKFIPEWYRRMRTYFYSDSKDKEVERKAKEILPKGSVIVFPSFVWHRVKPITQGTRYSLVVWHLGKPFK